MKGSALFNRFAFTVHQGAGPGRIGKQSTVEKADDHPRFRSLRIDKYAAAKGDEEGNSQRKPSISCKYPRPPHILFNGRQQYLPSSYHFATSVQRG